MSQNINLNSSKCKCEKTLLKRRVESTDVAFGSSDFAALACSVIKVINTPHNDSSDCIKELIDIIKDTTGFDAVGLRLKEGVDYPLYYVNGFSQEFFDSERSLITTCERGRCGSDVQLACICGHVAQRKEVDSQHFTRAGSFWIENAAALHESDFCVDRLEPRNRCIYEGYRSIAIIPIQSGREMLGLLLLHAKDSGRINREMVEFFEKLVECFALVLQAGGTGTLLQIGSQINEQRLIEAEDRFEKLFGLGLEAILIVSSSNYEILGINQAGVDMFGISLAQAVGMRIDEFWEGVDFKHLARIIDNSTNKSTSSKIQLQLLKVGQEPFQASISFQRVYYLGEDSVLFFISDLSEIEVLRSELKQAEKLAAVGQLVGGVAHDFNNQLTGILGYGEFLVANLSDPVSKRYAENIVTCAVRSADLTEKLLSFTRKSQHKMMPVDIHALITEVVNMLEHSIDRRISLGKKLVAATAITIGDSSQLQNVLLNLAINARDAIAGESGMITFLTDIVALDARFCAGSKFDVIPGEYISIKVRDTGLGMNREIMGKIFEPFFTTKREGEGTGMGLAAAYSTIKEHKGLVRVESQFGEGTTFEILLPLVNREVEQRAQKSAERGKGCILFADDEEIIRILAVQLLKDLGYKVITCTNGREAVDIYRQRGSELDLVVLDMIMPRMSGREAFLNIKSLDNKAKILITTGYAAGDDVKELINLGAVGVMKKPFYLEDLSEIMLRIFE